METLTQTTENQELSQEQLNSHEAAMIAKAENAEANSLEKDKEQFGTESSEEEAKLFAGKYKSPEALEKAYKELEAKLGAEKGVTNNETNNETTEETKDTEVEAPTNQEQAEELVSSKGLDFAELNSEYAENGSLSEATYKKLADAGITKETADAYIAGQEALAQQNVAKLQNSIGGESNFNDMISWAADNLSESEKVTFNNMVSNEASAEFAIKGLYARYQAEAEPRLLDGNVGATSNRGYMSQREMMADMASPKYRTDPAFRKMVEMKVARSKF